MFKLAFHSLKADLAEWCRDEASRFCAGNPVSLGLGKKDKEINRSFSSQNVDPHTA